MNHDTAHASDRAQIFSPPSEEPHKLVPHPEPASEVTGAASEAGAPQIRSEIAKQCAELGLFLVDAERSGGNLLLTVEGPHIEDVQGNEARRLAYDSRYDYGFSNAGIEIYGGSRPVGNGRYQQVYKLTRGI